MTFLAYATSNNGGLPYGSQTFTVNPSDDGTPVHVTIHTAPSGTVQGKVFAADGVTPITNQLNVALTDIDTGVSNVLYESGAGFSFTGVQNGLSGYRLTASFHNQYSGQVTATVSRNITTPNQIDTKNITLPVSSITSTVFLNDGITPVPNASLYAVENIKGYNYGFYGISADANGHYQFSGPITGSVTVYANDASGIYGQTTVNPTTDTASITKVNISLGPVGMVIGTIYDQNHLSVANAQVQVQSSGANGGFTDYVQTDAKGNYVASDIAVGNITVTATLPGGTTPTAQGVLSTNGQTVTIDIGTPPPPTGLGSVFGTVYDQNQDPNPGATVTITAADGTVVTVTTDPNGMYTSIGNIQLGAQTVVAPLTDGSTTQSVTGTIPDNVTPVEFDLGLNNPGDVSGTVIDINGDPIPNIEVQLDDSNDPNVTYGLNADSNGFFDFSQMIPGAITIQVFDSKGVQIGQGTGTLPYGGNVVINVHTMTVGAMLTRPQLRKLKPGVEVAGPAPQTPTPSPRQPNSVVAIQTSFTTLLPVSSQGVHP